MSERKKSTVNLTIEAPSPNKFNYDIEIGNLPK